MQIDLLRPAPCMRVLPSLSAPSGRLSQLSVPPVISCYSWLSTSLSWWSLTKSGHYDANSISSDTSGLIFSDVPGIMECIGSFNISKCILQSVGNM